MRSLAPSRRALRWDCYPDRFLKRLRLISLTCVSAGGPLSLGLDRLFTLSPAASFSRKGRASSATSVDLRLPSTSRLRALRLPCFWDTEARNFDQTSSFHVDRDLGQYSFTGKPVNKHRYEDCSITNRGEATASGIVFHRLGSLTLTGPRPYQPLKKKQRVPLSDTRTPAKSSQRRSLISTCSVSSMLLASNYSLSRASSEYIL